MTLLMRPDFETLKCDAAANQISVAFAFETLANRVFSKIAHGNQIRCDSTQCTTERQHTSAAAALRPVPRSQRKNLDVVGSKWASPRNPCAAASAEVARRLLGGCSEVARRLLERSNEKVVAFARARRLLGGARRLLGACAEVARRLRKSCAIAPKVPRRGSREEF